MAPKAISIANAGRKLTGEPPEGYSRKKEIWVRSWLTGVPAAEAQDGIPSSDAGSTSSKEVDSTVEELYRQLRDSTDGYDLALAHANGVARNSNAQRPAGSSPSKRTTGSAQRPSLPASKMWPAPLLPPAPPRGKPPAHAISTIKTTQQTVVSHSNGSATAVGVVVSGWESDLPTVPESDALTPGSMTGLVRVDSSNSATALITGNGSLRQQFQQPPQQQPRLSRASSGGSASVQPSAAAPPLDATAELGVEGVPGMSAPLSKGGSAESAAASLHNKEQVPTSSKGEGSVPSAAAPLPFVMDPDNDTTAKHSVAVAAGLLVARVEAAASSGGQTLDEADKFQRALMLAVAEKQKLSEEMRAELSAARALANSAHSGVESRVEVERRESAALKLRVGNAEAELQRVRAEAQRIQADYHGQKKQLDASVEDAREAVQRLQRQAQEAAERLQAQDQQREAAVLAAQQDAAASRTLAAAATRELRLLKREAELERANLELQVSALRAERQLRDTQLASAVQERDAALAGWKDEAARRIAAEQSEQRALRLANKQADLGDQVKQAQAAGVLLRQRSAAADQRAVMLRAPDPTAALALLPAAETPAAAPAAGAPRPQAVGTRPHSARVAAEQSSPTKSPRSRPAAGAALDVTELSRLDAHQQLSRAVAADQRVLGEAMRVQKRALLASQLRESKQVEEALANAPDFLKVLGLAFRVYLLAATATAGSLGAQLTAQLSPHFRMFVDPSLAQPSLDLTESPYLPDLAPSGSAMVSASAAVVLLATPGLLASSGRRVEVGEAALRGAQLIVVAPPDMTLPQLMQADPTAALGEQREKPVGLGSLPDQVATYLQAAWDQRVQLGGAHAAPPTSPEAGSSIPSGSPAAEVSRRLGLPDAALRLLNLGDLKLLAADKTHTLPDLRHLNSPRLRTLRLAWPPAAGGGPTDPAISSLMLDTVAAVLLGNTTLTALTMRGLPSADIPAVASLLHASACPLASVSLSTALPLGSLLGRVTPPCHDLDWSAATNTLQAQDCLLLAALLPHATPTLSSVALPACPASDLGSAAVAALASALAALPGLQRLNGLRLQSPSVVGGGSVLDAAGFALGPVGVAVLLSRLTAVSGLQRLTGLNLTGCELGPLGAAHLATAAAGGALSRARSVCLADNRLGPAGLTHVLQALTSSGLSEGGGGTALSGGATSLAVLDLSLNGLGDDGCRVLARHLAALPALTVLGLSGNNIQVEGVRALASALAGASSSSSAGGAPSAAAPPPAALQELQLSSNHLGDAAVSLLCGVLPSLTCLRSLQLQDNHSIGVHGAHALGMALATNHSLQELNLANNHLGVEGARQLAQGLGGSAGNSSLLSLNLEFCKLRAEGVEHVAAALSRHPTLVQLHLARNSSGDKGAKALADALAINARLRTLDLRSNAITLTGCSTLSAVLRDRNTTLRLLSMSDNAAEDRTLQELERLATGERTIFQRRPLDFSIQHAGGSRARTRHPVVGNGAAAATHRDSGDRPPAVRVLAERAQSSPSTATGGAVVHSSNGDIKVSSPARSASIGKSAGGAVHSPPSPSAGPLRPASRGPSVSAAGAGVGVGGVSSNRVAMSGSPSGPSRPHSAVATTATSVTQHRPVTAGNHRSPASKGGTPDEQIELEEAMARYRVPREGGADSGAPLIDMGYTGMRTAPS